MIDIATAASGLKYLMRVPPNLEAAVRVGRAYVEGAVVKDSATKTILAHLQRTPLGINQLMAVAGGGPGVAQLASSVVANVQLEQVKSMISVVQTLSAVAAAASVINLGVSVVGFAVLASRLKHLGSRLDAVAADVGWLKKIADAEHTSKLETHLTRVNEAFLLGSEAERLRYWREADTALHELAEFYRKLLVEPGHDQAVSELRLSDRAELWTWSAHAATARLEVLMLLDQGVLAADYASRIALAFGTLHEGEEVLVRSLLRGKLVGPAAIEQARAQAASYIGLTSHLRRELEQSADKLQFMVGAGVSTRTYLLETRSHELDAVLLLPVDQEGLAAAMAG